MRRAERRVRLVARVEVDTPLFQPPLPTAAPGWSRSRRLTPGMRAQRGEVVCVQRRGVRRRVPMPASCDADHVRPRRRRSARSMRSRRSLMMNSALQTIASVSATSQHDQRGAGLVAAAASERIGRISMVSAASLRSSVAMAGVTWQARQVGQQAGEQAGGDGEREGGQRASPGRGARASRVVRRLLAQRPQAERSARPGRARRRPGRPRRPRSGTARRSRGARRRARGARRSRGAARRNFASSRPTVLTRHTSRKPNASHVCRRDVARRPRAGAPATPSRLRSRMLSGRGKRPSFFCSVDVVGRGTPGRPRPSAGVSSCTQNWIQMHSARRAGRLGSPSASRRPSS